MKTRIKIGLLPLLLSLSGCSASLQAVSTPPGYRAAPPSPHCAGLDHDRALFGALAQGTAIIGGGTGLATLPVTTDDARIALASGTIGAAALTALFSKLERDATEYWARDCTGERK